MARRFIDRYTVTLEKEDGRRRATLLWGDPVETFETVGNRVKVRARTMWGWVPRDALTDQGLLELYVIDVGQGDGVLLRTPDDRWHLIDAGVANRTQMTKKGAANFLRWKFLEDLRAGQVTLENVIVTHPDFDHYGGLLDVFSGTLYDGRTFGIDVAHFYHCGMGRFADAPRLGRRERGTAAAFPEGYHRIQRRGSFITELLSDRDSFQNPTRAFAPSFQELAALVATVPDHVSRLSREDRFVPGYGPGDGPVVMHVLGPVVEHFGSGKRGLRYLESSDSKTRNGHSVVLRLDYGDARILLTGDLNEKSQRLLMSYVPAEAFAADVAKGCHHGSEDIDLDFIRAIRARVTVISSGDNEDYAHPRPLVMGASSRYGREALTDRDAVIPPLLYSTELARSVKLAYATSVRVDVDQDPATPSRYVAARDTVIKAGKGYRKLERTPVSTNLIYGLVNIRTDGRHILCATMEEKGNDFDVKVIQAGRDAPG